MVVVVEAQAWHTIQSIGAQSDHVCGVSEESRLQLTELRFNKG